MKISVVVPSYNQGDYIEQTLKSLLCQQAQVIVYDGKSIDQTLSILEKYRGSLEHFRSESDRGQSHAINKGLRRATGEVVNWINSDDYLQPRALDQIAKAFEEQKTNVLLGKSNIVRGGEILRQSRGTDIFKGNIEKTIGRARIDQPETWWRKSVIDEIGPLNESLHFTMDRDWWIKYLLRFGLHGIHETDAVLANFRLHDESKTVSQRLAFDLERNSYYRSLAQYYGLNRESLFLSNHFQTRVIPMTNLPEHVDLQVLHNSYAHFFLLLAEESYATGDHVKIRNVLKRIDSNALSGRDMSVYSRLKFRSRLPSSFISFARRWSG